MSWAEVLRECGELETAAIILQQGVEFHPESAEIQYQLAGTRLLLNQSEAAMVALKKAIGQAPDQLESFEKIFPELSRATWVQRVIRECRKASK